MVGFLLAIRFSRHFLLFTIGYMYAGDPTDVTHRAFTVLVYLVSPEGDEGDAGSGGTRFLLLLDGERGSPITLRPAAGDALVWPNFDRDGGYSRAPLHEALALGVGQRKVVANMWFEGRAAQ